MLLMCWFHKCVAEGVVMWNILRPLLMLPEAGELAHAVGVLVL